MRRKQRVDVAGDLHVRAGEHDQVVADAFEIGDEMRREHDADTALGDDLHQVLEELAPRERIQARDRLVEEQQLGPLRDRQREGELRALTAGERSRALTRIEVELARCALGEVAIPVRVEPRTHCGGAARPTVRA